MNTMRKLDLYNDLMAAIDHASKDEQRLEKHVSNGKRTNRDPGWMARLQDITSMELPNAIGKFIETLELHKEFQSLGRFVRSFEDVAFVMQKLQEPFYRP